MQVSREPRGLWSPLTQPDLMVPSAGAGWGPPATSLGWIPQTQGTSEARDLRPPPCNSPCLRSLFPLCLWSSIPSPWLQRASCDSRIRAKQFPRDGETTVQPREPQAPPPPLFPLAVPPPRAPPLAPAVFCRTPTG